MVLFLYSFCLSLSAVLCKLSSQDCQMSSGFLLPPTQQTGAPIWKLGLLGQGTDVLVPWGLCSVLRGPHPFGKSGSIWDSFAKDYTTGSLPMKDLPSSFIPWWFFSFGSTFFKICSLHFSSLRGIRWRPSAAGKAVSTQRGDLDDSEGLSFGVTVGEWTQSPDSS